MHVRNWLPNSEMLMKQYLAVFSLACAAPFLVLAEKPPTRIRVGVELTGDDGLTQKLSNEIAKYIQRVPGLQTVGYGTGDFVIASGSNVNWDTLDGKKVIIYRVALRKGDEPLTEAVGVCFERRPQDCAKKIIARFKGIMESHRD